MQRLSRLFSRYWFVPILLVLVVIAVDRIDPPESVEVEETINMSETRSDYYMADFSTRKYTADGQLEYSVQGETLAHYQHNDRSEITAPRVKLHRPDTIWQISSLQGSFDTEPELFTLEGDVLVERISSSPEVFPVTIRTSSISVATATNEVRTDQPIEITAHTWHLQAVGLESAIDGGTLSLLSNVTGRYEVTNP